MHAPFGVPMLVGALSRSWKALVPRCGGLSSVLHTLVTHTLMHTAPLRSTWDTAGMTGSQHSRQSLLALLTLLPPFQRWPYLPQTPGLSRICRDPVPSPALSWNSGVQTVSPTPTAPDISLLFPSFSCAGDCAGPCRVFVSLACDRHISRLHWCQGVTPVGYCKHPHLCSYLPLSPLPNQAE